MMGSCSLLEYLPRGGYKDSSKLSTGERLVMIISPSFFPQGFLEAGCLSLNENISMGENLRGEVPSVSFLNI